MKIKQFFLIVFSGIVLGLLACKTNAKVALVKKWKAKIVEGLAVTPEMKKAITNENALEFTKDGRYITYRNGEKFDRGTYILSENEKAINISSGTSKTEVINVLELGEDKLIGEMHGITITFEPSK